ncbi:MAG: chemotaxis protein [Lachnospiraceae bacterium]|nr:chemotaxis protein [Lachnospiraceae bacterium]
MTNEQLKRANKAVFPIMLIIMGYLLLTMAALIISMPSAVSWRTYVQLAAVIVSMAVILALFFAKRDTRLCGTGMMAAGAFVYVVFRLVNTSEGTGIYAYPILFASMAYLNIRMTIFGNIAIVGANMIRILLNLQAVSGGDGELIVMNLFVSILMAYASICITRILVRFNEENTGVIAEAARKQKESNDIMVTVADNIIRHFGEAMDSLQKLGASLDNNHTSMEHIAESTESTAEAIQEDAQLCGEILQQADYAGEVAQSMLAASDRVNAAVESGASSVQELGRQADSVSSSSKVVEEVIAELTAKVEKVGGFVDTILSISAQTNLLALNASIEAARAGEAGRGFSVVAEEIRQLSEDTKAASNNITSIIRELNADTQLANESIGNAVDSVARQNDLVCRTRAKFGQVSQETGLLSHNIGEVNRCMDQTRALSNRIHDNISQLSASSEEIAAASNEGLKDSDVTVEQVAGCRKIFQAIYELAKDLKRQ